MLRCAGSLLLSLCLLLSQHAGLRHGLAHVGEALESAHAAQRDEHRPAHGQDGDAPCDTCLAFAHIAVAAQTTWPDAALLGGLRFHASPRPAFAALEAERPAPRSRGPPTLL